MHSATLVGFVLASASVARAQVFVDVGAEVGIGTYQMASGKAAGVAAADFDDDGDIDLFVPTEREFPDLLYRNDAGLFTEIGAAAGVASTGRHRLGLFFDADGDGMQDLLVAGDCYAVEPGCVSASIVLYRQSSPGQFEDVTEDSGLTEVLATYHHRGGACVADYDGDGMLDLVLSVWQGPLRLFRNTGSMTFEDVTSSAGMVIEDVGHYQPVALDANDDGLIDIFCAVDFAPNRLWINEGDLKFTEHAADAGVDYAFNEMGVTVSDMDNDGDLDIYVTAITALEMHDTLFRKDGPLAYTDVAAPMGVEDADFAWGATFADFDMDTRLDLAVTNGTVNYGDPSRLFRNVGGEFEDVSEAWGFADHDWGSALVSLDFDRDGDLDLLQACAEGGPLRLLENTSEGNWLVVRPRMGGANRHAIGTVVVVDTADATMARLVTAGTSILAQEPAEAHVGLGEAPSASVTVLWPDGRETVLDDVSANQVLDVTPCEADANADGVLNVLDFVAFQLAWQSQDPGADCDGNGVFNVVDFVCFQLAFVAGCP